MAFILDYISYRRIIIASALLEFIGFIFLFDKRVAVDGYFLAILFSLLTPLLIVWLGLASYNPKNIFARSTFCILVAIAYLAAYRAGFSSWKTEPILFVTGAALLLQTIALATLFGRKISSGV